VKTVGVVGLGAMCSGIAQLALEAGFDVVGHEVEHARGEQARERIAHFLTRKVEKGTLEQAARDDAVARLRLTTDLAGLAGCDVVIEAAFEDLAVKHELFRALEAAVRPDAILATNTSALSVTEIASATEHQAVCIPRNLSSASSRARKSSHSTPG
jgi:3-hydroxyacyl-CoA dehydrogenase